MVSGLWCSECGHPAELLSQSLDPDHPLVLCQRLNGHGEVAHPAPRPGIRDTVELAQVMREHTAAKRREAHRRHVAALVRSCPYCQAMREALFA
jgi:hypothetical protein